MSKNVRVVVALTAPGERPRDRAKDSVRVVSASLYPTSIAKPRRVSFSCARSVLSRPPPMPPMPTRWWWLRFASRIRNTGRRRPRRLDTGFGTKERWNSPLSMPHRRSPRVVASSRRESCSLSSSRAFWSLHVRAVRCEVLCVICGRVMNRGFLPHSPLVSASVGSFGRAGRPVDSSTRPRRRRRLVTRRTDCRASWNDAR